MTPAPSTSGVLAAQAISGHLDTRTAATEVAHALHDGLGADCDLLLVFASFHHRAALRDAAALLRGAMTPRAMLGVTAESVLAGERELEGRAGLAALALHLPGVEVTTWHHDPRGDGAPLDDPEALRAWLGAGTPPRGLIMLADPFTTPAAPLLEAFARLGGDAPVPVVGGLASGSSQPGLNVLVRDDRTVHAGAIGVTLSGPVVMDALVSQGCRPIGEPFVVTKCHGNTVLELGGQRALDALQALARGLSEDERRLLSGGLQVGFVIDEYRPRFGRGDFLIRNAVGFDQRVGGIVVGEAPRVGQTIQFHARDATTAREDLHLLLDAQQLRPPAAAGLLVTCNGRGERLFGEPDHDVAAIRERLGEIPLAGFFAAGEIGPVGDRSFVHGHTASLALLRPPDDA